LEVLIPDHLSLHASSYFGTSLTTRERSEDLSRLLMLDDEDGKGVEDRKDGASGRS
jgi:hypothetical protein